MVDTACSAKSLSKGAYGLISRSYISSWPSEPSLDVSQLSQIQTTGVH